MKFVLKKDKTTLGYSIIGACILILCCLMVSAFVLKDTVYDSKTLCPKAVTAHTIIIIDKTDFLNENQKRYLENYVDQIKDRLALHEKLSVFALTGKNCIAPVPKFSRCTPGTGENANPLYQNPKKISGRFHTFFSKPLNDAVDDTLQNRTDSESPLFEMIRELSFRKDFGNNIPSRNLIFISDMMHHTASYSHYRDRVDYSSFSERSYRDEIQADLDSVQVTIIYLRRGKLDRIQGERHLAFWNHYFQSMGARVTEVRNVR